MTNLMLTACRKRSMLSWIESRTTMGLDWMIHHRTLPFRLVPLLSTGPSLSAGLLSGPPTTVESPSTTPAGRGVGRGRGRVRARGRRQAMTRQPGKEEQNEWTSEPSQKTVKPFTQPIGPTIQLGISPLEVFTPTLVEHIVFETNKYTALCLSSIHQGARPPPTWEADAAEIRSYLGFAILMGFCKLPDLYDYWSTDLFLHYFPVTFRISRKRFLEIQRFLHFTDNETTIPCGELGYDRLAKVRPVIEALQHQQSYGKIPRKIYPEPVRTQNAHKVWV